MVDFVTSTKNMYGVKIFNIIFFKKVNAINEEYIPLHHIF